MLGVGRRERVTLTGALRLKNLRPCDTVQFVAKLKLEVSDRKEVLQNVKTSLEVSPFRQKGSETLFARRFSFFLELKTRPNRSENLFKSSLNTLKAVVACPKKLTNEH